MSKVTV